MSRREPSTVTSERKSTGRDKRQEEAARDGARRVPLGGTRARTRQQQQQQDSGHGEQHRQPRKTGYIERHIGSTGYYPLGVR